MGHMPALDGIHPQGWAVGQVWVTGPAPYLNHVDLEKSGAWFPRRKLGSVTEGGAVRLAETGVAPGGARPPPVVGSAP